MYKIVIFDLGDTIYEYDGVPLSWESHYQRAFSQSLEKNGITPSEEMINQCIDHIKKYNARINYRIVEYSHEHIFFPLWNALGIPNGKWMACILDYFDYFKQTRSLFGGAQNILSELHNSEIKVAALTDVPYGMPKSLVLDDLKHLDIADFFDLIISSVDVGKRKPDPAGYRAILHHFKCDPEHAVFIGNEEKDIKGANAANIRNILYNPSQTFKSFGQNFEISCYSQIDAVLEVL